MLFLVQKKKKKRCTMMINQQCNESARVHALVPHLHTVIKFLLSTAPFLAAAFFRAPLNPRLGDAMPASCAALSSSCLVGCPSALFFPFLSVLCSSRGPAVCSRRRVAQTEGTYHLGCVPISPHCSPLRSAWKYYATFR